MPLDSGEKTEAPTPRRLQEARERGQVAKSSDLTAAVGLLAGLMLLHSYSGAIGHHVMDLMRRCLAVDQVPKDAWEVADAAWRFSLSHMVAMLAPFFLVLVVVAVAINLVQVGFVYTTRPITPNLEKISPISGFKRLFSVRTVVRLGMNLTKVAVIAAVAYFTIVADLPALVGLAGLDSVQVVSASARLVFLLGLRLAAVLLVLALLDFAFQKWQYQQDLRMSKEEVKEELKRMEGDPIMRQRRRAVARQLAQQRMSQAVPQADVVITNPTHLAVALRYDHETMAAPKVVAKGAGFIAQRIREIALAHQVPVIERKPLAQALYKACEVGDFVPEDLYKAVAEVLAYVFELAGKGRRRPVALG